MGLITAPKTWVDNEVLNFSDLNSTVTTIYNEFNGGIDNDNIDASAAIAYSKLDLSTSITTGDVSNSSSLKLGNIPFFIDGGGAEIATGVRGWVEVGFDCTITAGRLLADQSGSIVVDIWKDTYANYPPTNADSITSATPLTISSALKSEDTTLSGWTTSVTAGNILYFNVDSIDTITQCLVSLTYRKA